MLMPAQRLLMTLGLAIVTALSPLAGTAQAQIPDIQLAQPKYAAIVVDAGSGEVLYAKRADSPRYPASITKIMTLYLAFDALAAGRMKLDDPVIISPRAAAQAPVKLGLRAGESLTVSEAMQAMAIKSANDIAVALAEKIGGSEARFATMMTLKAQELGMANSHFVNASGLPDSRQLSSARDIAILSRAVLRDYPQYYGVFSQQTFTFRGQTMNNHNGLLGRMPGVDGLKTGFTNASGHNLAVSAVRDNHRLIAVVIGGPSNATRDLNAEDLLLTGFDVMSRRARGEKITIAQNLFEAEPKGAVVGSTVGQGDSEQDGDRIVLTSAAPPRNISNLDIVEPRATALKVDRKKAEKAETGRWVVQVGAFRSKDLANKQIKFVENRFGKQFDGAEGRVAELSGSYRAQFKGFDQDDAKDACQALKAKRLACMIVSPS